MSDHPVQIVTNAREVSVLDVGAREAGVLEVGAREVSARKVGVCRDGSIESESLSVG